MRGKNLNAPEWIQREKIGVAGDEMASMAAHREFKELFGYFSASIRICFGSSTTKPRYTSSCL